MGLMGRCGCDIWRLEDLFSFLFLEHGQLVFWVLLSVFLSEMGSLLHCDCDCGFFLYIYIHATLWNI